MFCLKEIEPFHFELNQYFTYIVRIGASYYFQFCAGRESVNQLLKGS